MTNDLLKVLNKYKSDRRAWFKTYKATLKCIRCGEGYAPCLQFHHRNANTKKAEVNRMAHNGCSKKRIMAEIAKCDVLCANCHTKLHYPPLPSPPPNSAPFEV